MLLKSRYKIYFTNFDATVIFIQPIIVAAYRAKHKNMETFPKQVCTAESLIANGNPNILSDPEFASQKRENYAATLFGTPSPRKSPRGGVTKKAKGRSPISKLIYIINILFLNDWPVRP